MALIALFIIAGIAVYLTERIFAALVLYPLSY